MNRHVTRGNAPDDYMWTIQGVVGSAGKGLVLN